PQVVVDASDDVQGSDPEPGPDETSVEESAWTTEVSFSRAVEPERVEEEQAVEADEPAVEPEVEVVAAASESDDVRGSDLEPGPPETSAEEPVWTTEVSFSRAVEPERVEEEPAAEADEPAVEPEVEVVAAASESDDVQGSDLEPGPPETSAEEPVWTKEVSFSRAVEPEPVDDHLVPEA